MSSSSSTNQNPARDPLYQQIVAAVNADPTIGRHRLAAQLGTSESGVQRRLSLARKCGDVKTAPVAAHHPRKSASPAAQVAVRTLADFRREHDQAWKIRDGLKRLFAGGVIMTDAEFREAVNGNPSRWRAAADLPEFREFRYRVAGEVLWAARDTIVEMRKIKGEVI